MDFLGPVSATPVGLVDQVRVLEGEVSVLGSHMKQEWKARRTHQPHIECHGMSLFVQTC